MLKRTLIPMILSGVFINVTGLEVKQHEREFTVSTSRLEATVKDGRIIHLTNRKNGNVVADRRLNEFSRTAGLGNMTGKIPELSKLHFPWGEPALDQNKPLSPTSLYRRPTADSTFRVEKRGDMIRAEWKGLSNGKDFFPDDCIALEFSKDEQGALAIRGEGQSVQGGVFGIQIPIENLQGQGRFVLPTFGGLEYDAQGAPTLMTFQDTTLFYEAPVMTYSFQNSAFGMWAEDSTFRPYFAFFGRGKKGSSFALEFLNFMPFENLQAIKSPVLKLDVFSDCDWIGAARPYRDWYRKTFAEDIARRDGIEWAEKINVIVDSGPCKDEKLREIASLMNPSSVLFQFWQARKEGFTTNMPDYTPRQEYPGQVQMLHGHGFKAMCYVCSLCATYRSPVWDRDNVGDFFLTRKNSITNYLGGSNAFDENLTGTINAASGGNPYAGIKPGKLIYGDPLSKKWREYFIQLVYDFNKRTGTDANYQDTLGCAADVGNGIVDGLAGAAGNAALTRELQAKMPDTPMAAEFGPAPIAFGVKWPLNYAQVWGGRKFRESRARRHHPLTPFLFGYRTWIPVVNAGDDFHKYLISACSDALSGMGMFSASGELQVDEGFDGLLLLRSKIFADHNLTPYYPEKRYPENIRAMYKSHDGRIFRYYDDGALQMMLDPDGKPLYGRVTGVNQLKNTQLTLPGWPVRDRNGIYGLNPERYYALFPVNSSNIPGVTVKPLPEGANLARYYSTPDFAYLEFRGNGEADIELQVPAGYIKGYVNDQPVTVASEMKLSGALPMRIFLSTGKATRPDRIRKINMTNGLQSGPVEVLPALRKQLNGREFFHVNYYQVKSLDFVLSVNNPDDALEFFLQNTQDQYGNGSIVRLLINGNEIRSFDCAAEKRDNRTVFDTRIRRWLVPLGKYAGKEILVTVQVDDKASTNADMQWITIPELIRDKQQQFNESIIAPAAPSKQGTRPDGKVLETLEPQWNNPQITVQAEGQGRAMVYQPNTAHGLVASPERIKIDPARTYYLSGEFRKPVSDDNLLFLGVYQLKANGGIITGNEINAMTGTDTVLSHAAKSGSTEMKILDASGWRVGGLVALQTLPDRSDLPNNRLYGPITGLVKHGGDWTVTLKTPLKDNIPSDTSVRLHMPVGTHQYVGIGKLTDEWKSFGGALNWWPGAAMFQVIMLSKSPIEFRNLKLEVIEIP